MTSVVRHRFGGDISLDFVNTVDSWVRPLRRDDLSGFDRLAAWSAQVGLMSVAQAGRLSSLPRERTEGAFHEAIRLRASLLSVFTEQIAGRKIDDKDLKLLNDLIRYARTQQKLVFESHAFEWRSSGEMNPRMPAALVALHAGNLLTSDDLGRVKQCPGPDGCGWLFVDRSRNRSRKWCSMELCGGFAKARRFAEKCR